MAQVNPLKFVQQVRSEVGKIAWPNRREVLLTTLMVFAMAVVTATFFSLIDILFQTGLQSLLHMFR